MKILQIAQSERGGGASKVAFDLHKFYINEGHDARLLVKFPRTNFPGLIAVDAFAGTSLWAPFCKVVDRVIGKFNHFCGQRLLREILWGIAWPQRFRDKYLGIEDFNYPYSKQLLNGNKWNPDLIHLHNVSSNFFDLRSLVFLSHQVPTIVTLHDGWFFTGHCAHPIDCDRWRTGCGMCPDLGRMPSVRRDNTHANWLRKKSIYSQSRLFVGSPSNWLLSKAQESILTAKDTRVINNGIDLDVFSPGDKNTARGILGLPQNIFICLCVAATGSKYDAYKDYSTIVSAVDKLHSTGNYKDLLFVCVGGQSHKEFTQQVRHIGYISDPKQLSQYYRAADVFLHAANAENFPLTLLESQACGTPVIATDVAGIPETIQNGGTGILVPRHGVDEMVDAVIFLSKNKKRCEAMGQAAANWAKNRFDTKKHASQYLEWYREILNQWEK